MFVPGLDLAEVFHREVLAPLVGEPHAAALLGEGSEVLGFDTSSATPSRCGAATWNWATSGARRC